MNRLDEQTLKLSLGYQLDQDLAKKTLLVQTNFLNMSFKHVHGIRNKVQVHCNPLPLELMVNFEARNM